MFIYRHTYTEFKKKDEAVPNYPTSSFSLPKHPIPFLLVSQHIGLSENKVHQKNDA
jgi:hypothetical protein